MKAQVITCNNEIRAVHLGDTDTAQIELGQLRVKDFEKSDWSFQNCLNDYLFYNKWEIIETEVKG